MTYTIISSAVVAVVAFARESVRRSISRGIRRMVRNRLEDAMDLVQCSYCRYKFRPLDQFYFRGKRLTLPVVGTFCPECKSSAFLLVVE